MAQSLFLCNLATSFGDKHHFQARRVSELRRDPFRMSLNNNTYATKKTIAQGMLDIALLTANASQLRYILQVGPDNHEFYTPMLVMLISSMSLQALNGLA